MKDYVAHSNQSRCMELYAKLLQQLTQNKLYLSPDVTAARLAEVLDCSPRHISAAVQIGANCNFNALLNGLRLKEVCRRLSSPRLIAHTVEDIGLSCGFRSRQAFYLAFERHMGVTPLQWREAHLQKGKKRDK